MESEFNHDNKKSVIRLALFIGELMLINGAETYRVEDTILRICKSRKLDHINVFISPTAIIISDYRFDGYTFMKTIKSRSINLSKISLLNNFSRKFVSNTKLSIIDAMEELKTIIQTKPYKPFLTYVCTGFSSAFFSLLLEGYSILTFLFTFITSVIAVIIFRKTMKISSIPAFSSLISSAFIATIGVILTEINILSTPAMLIVGAILPLLSGVSFIKGIRDLIAGDLISGVARSFEAAINSISIACGVGIILDIWFRLGGNL